ncbi:Vps54-domain-containing protein [Fistulina hepatica ATCC 64428]|nr:Vps54-domain-containing protein [Fistulina hepatica ATCC 64428]
MSDSSSVSPSVTGTSTPGELPERIPGPSAAKRFRFHFDASSRRAPESTTGTTENGAADDFPTGHSFAQSWGLNGSSLNLAIPSEWSSSTQGFNAISTVLNNPHKRQAPPKPHSTLPAVPPADLPRVRRKDFDSYLRAVGDEWEKFDKAKKVANESDEIGGLDSDYVDKEEGPSTPRAASFRPGKNMPSLDQVPSVFFQPNFDLSDPKIWDLVTQQDVQADAMPLRSLPLLEKFSHYADIVEQHLAHEITLRSPSFFAALSNLNSLQSESESCLKRVQSLRRRLKQVDEGSQKGLFIVEKAKHLERMSEAMREVERVKSIAEVMRVGRSLATESMWSDALGVVTELEEMWEGHAAPPPEDVPPRPNGHGRLSPLPPTREEDEESSESRPDNSLLTLFKSPRPPSTHVTPNGVPLSQLQAFAQLPEHLRELTVQVARELSKELVAVLTSDLGDRINQVPKVDGPTTSQDAPEHVDAREEQLQDRLRPLLQSLVKTRGIKDALTGLWRTEVTGVARSALAVLLPVGSLEDAESNQPDNPLSKHMHSMSHSDFMPFLRTMYASMLRAIEGVRDQGTIIVDVLQHLGEFVPFDQLQRELSDILCTFAESVNGLCGRILACRSEQHAQLTMTEFVELDDDTWGFVLSSETVSGRMIVGLRSVIASQGKAFLQAYHQVRLTQSAKLVEDEQWSPVEVPEDLQRLINIMVDSVVTDSPTWAVRNTAVSHSAPQTNGFMSAITSMATRQNGTREKLLYIDSQSFWTVSATSAVLYLVADYLKVIVNLPKLTTETMSRVIEFLKAFNSRTCQVVLGAGAMRSAGLKNITAKHLALASQSLSIMISLIPYVRETFRRHLRQTQVVILVEFDKLKRDYQEHQHEVHQKLIAIMNDRLSFHVKTLRAINWEVPTKDPVNSYMSLLVKETTTLHKVLSKYLPGPVVEYVMTQVYAAINHRLSEEYQNIDLPHQEAKTKMLEDARYLHNKFAALKNIGTPSSMLETIIAEKSVRRPPPPAPTPVRSSTMHNLGSANQRLKGLLSGKSSAAEKELPSPMVRSPSPPPSVSPPRFTRSPSPVQRTTSPAALDEPSSPRSGSVNGVEPSRESSAGFKEAPPLPPQSRPSSPLPTSNGGTVPNGDVLEPS